MQKTETESGIQRSDADMIQDRIQYLSDNTDFLRTVFENLIGYAIIAADFDGNIIAYNEGARQIYGYAPEEVIGKQNIEIFFPKDFIESAGLQQIIDNLIGKDGFSYEGEKVRKNGSRFPSHILFTLTKDKDNKVVGFIEIVQDLTEQKRAKDALQKAHDELEIRVRERTAELAKTNEELRTEIAERKQADEALNKSEKDLRKRVKELEEFYDMAVGRELRMIELKDVIKRLESELKRYKNP